MNARKQHGARWRRHAWLLVLAGSACGDSDPTGPGAPSPFNIQVRFIGSMTTAQRASIQGAVGRWRSALASELPDVPITVQANTCFPDQPAISETVDDLLLYVRFAELDGPGGTIAQAGPCFIRSNTSLPLLGSLTIDSEDVANLARTGVFDDVVLHELGHVLGIGTLWGALQLLSGAGGANPQFLGQFAGAEYHALAGGATTVPVENTGGTGTRDGHWREAVFGNELMTGTLNLGGNPLSAMTIASLQDIGYQTDEAAASPYTLPAAAIVPDAQGAALQLHLHEELLRPLFVQ